MEILTKCNIYEHQIYYYQKLEYVHYFIDAGLVCLQQDFEPIFPARRKKALIILPSRKVKSIIIDSKSSNSGSFCTGNPHFEYGWRG